MTQNPAKARMLRGEAAIGVSVGLGSPYAAEILSRSGFDFVLVDLQHGAWDDNLAALAFRSIALGAAVPMARVTGNDFYAIGRLLDRGALGIIVPMVNTAQEAQDAAFAVRYPPRGGRSWSPTLAMFHGTDYAQRIDDEVFLAIQIETVQAVENAEAILSTEGVDGLWLGPNDLARSMGVPFGSPEHEQMILHVLEVCKRVGKIPGIAADNNLRHWMDHGFLFVTATSDAALIIDNAPRFVVGRDAT